VGRRSTLRRVEFHLRASRRASCASRSRRPSLPSRSYAPNPKRARSRPAYCPMLASCCPSRAPRGDRSGSWLSQCVHHAPGQLGRTSPGPLTRSREVRILRAAPTLSGADRTRFGLWFRGGSRADRGTAECGARDRATPETAFSIIEGRIGRLVRRNPKPLGWAAGGTMLALYSASVA
jgi:hypothetical protein